MRYILFISFSVLLLSCSEKKSPATIIAELNASDTFLIDDPPLSKDPKIELRRNAYWDAARKGLGLAPIYHGLDSVEIRIWYGGTISGQRLIILANRYNKWSAEIFKYFKFDNPDYKEKKDSLMGWNVDEKFIYEGSSYYAAPKSGWNSFIKRLFALGIVSMPDESKVNKPARIVLDGWGILIEVATENAFRKYSYGNPDLYYKVCPECKSICEIVKLIEDEFHLSYITDFEKAADQ